MPTDMTLSTGSARRGWMGRMLHRLSGGPPRRDSSSREATDRAPAPAPLPARPEKMQGVTARLVTDDRYVFVLLNDASDDIEERDARPAWKALHAQMAVIPGGLVQLVRGDGQAECADVPAYYLDRCAVTNAQFLRFVRSGGYDQLEIWPREVWSSLMRFTDETGQPGPRDWQRGTFAAGKADHPVVGVCWHEAHAYARWVGKRLPTAAEWQKAGGWPEHLSGGSCNRYPWGDIFDPARANLWASGREGTVPVRDFAKGSTPNGIHQLAGNVWEWLDDPLVTIPCHHGEVFQPWKPLRRIAGGAFNTYFPAEATCQFITGQPELDRCPNIGFRCALSADRLRPS